MSLDERRKVRDGYQVDRFDGEVRGGEAGWIWVISRSEERRVGKECQP